MSNSIDIVIKAVDKASSVVNGSKNALDGLGSAFSSVTGMSLTAAGVIGGVAAAIKSSIDTTVKLTDEVRDLSRTLGISAEEASKLASAADDVFISNENLTTGLRSAINKGYQPTIAGLKEMSAQYNSIQDPIERSKFLLDTFGRSGLEMGKLMEKGAAGIDKLGQAAKVIFSKTDLDKMEDYKQKVDDLGDTWTKLKTTVGVETAPIIAEALDWITRAAENAISLSHQWAEINQAIWGIEVYNDVKTLNEALRDHNQTLDEYYEGMKLAVSETENLGDAADDVKDIEINLHLASDIETQLDEVERQLAGGGKLDEMGRAISDALAKGEITPEQAQAMLGELYIAEQQLQVRMDNITASQAAKNIQDTLGGSLTDARDDVNNVQQYLDKLTSTDYVITVKTVFIGGSNVPPPPEDITDDQAFGGSFRVPAAYGFENYNLPGASVSGGERISVTPEGEVLEVRLDRESINALVLGLRDELVKVA